MYANQEYWRLITPVFLHAGIIHLCANLYFQIRVAGAIILISLMFTTQLNLRKI